MDGDGMVWAFHGSLFLGVGRVTNITAVGILCIFRFAHCSRTL